ncbi:hypothetical protein H920_11478 [Fukomys damarensis]|uniref:Uncharacterized protein n=1 Tax=Fukomys damarensis TaxID=885580 RepID=A0A091D9A4_FUKDA|nr:hypothetical protein H920_11478 [Fukomys damarensis]
MQARPSRLCTPWQAEVAFSLCVVKQCLQSPPLCDFRCEMRPLTVAGEGRSRQSGQRNLDRAASAEDLEAPGHQALALLDARLHVDTGDAEEPLEEQPEELSAEEHQLLAKPQTVAAEGLSEEEGEHQQPEQQSSSEIKEVLKKWT